jgi:myosin heavy subunit
MTNNEAIRKSAMEISEKIKESSPILEAFGNAKTKNNDNSSRFGKFIRLQFNRQGIIQGADVVNYLLEKSRLMSQGPDERSYHIFYQLLAGATGEEKTRLKLTKADDYICIMQGKCTQIEGVDDKADFAAVRHAMNVVGMTQEEQESIFRVVASILHLQNIKFKDLDDATQVENDNPLAIAAELLRVDMEGLKNALMTKTIVIMNKSIVSPLTAQQATDARDALSKALYNELFNWIIRKLNERTKSDVEDCFIGLLDIFGFEMFEVNSFEQFCINFANETLQNHYNAYTFKRDQAECEAEGIDGSQISFRDNAPCIELIQGKMGILDILDDQSNLSKSTDVTLLQNLKKQFEKKHPFFVTDPRKQSEFTIVHFAGKVEYNVTNWLEKNRDILKFDLVALMAGSKCSFVANVLPKQEESGKKITVAGSFKRQLIDLLSLINSTTPHWIRTIKPHPAKKPNMFSKPSVMNQLRSSGVLDTVRLRREGYSARIPLVDFWKKYRVLIDEANTDDYKASCTKIVQKAKFDKFKAQIGITRVFMRSFAYTELEQLRNQKLLSSIKIIQKYSRGYLSRKRAFMLREAIRLKMEQEEYEIHKEELMRLKKEREERERYEREKREREAIERKRLEEIRKIEEERLLREREEREKIEKLRKEVEEKERGKLEELKKKQQERIAELTRLENERKERERIERERIEQDRAEQLRKEELEHQREMDERRQEMIVREQTKLEQERVNRLNERKDKFFQRQREKHQIQDRATKRKEKAQVTLKQEQMLKRQREIELQQLALIARSKLEEEKRAWEEDEWRRLEHEIILEQHQKEEKIIHEREKIKRIGQVQEQKKFKLANQTRAIHDKMARVQRRQQMIQEEREDFIKSEIDKRLDRKKDLERRRQEQEVLTMEKQSQLLWEIEKEKRRTEMRAELKRRLQNDKLKDNWRISEIHKSILKEREKDDHEQYILENELKKEYEDLTHALERGRDGIKSSHMYRTDQAKKDQHNYEENLAKLKKKIAGVFTTSVGREASPTSKILNRSSGSPALTMRDHPSLKRAPQYLTISVDSPAGRPTIPRPSSAMSYNSPVYTKLARRPINSPKPGSFSNLYK